MSIYRPQDSNTWRPPSTSPWGPSVPFAPPVPSMFPNGGSCGCRPVATTPEHIRKIIREEIRAALAKLRLVPGE